MKKFVLLLACMVCGYMQSFAQTNRGDSSLGFNLGYGFESENATLGIDYRYNITDEVRVAPSLTYFVKADNLSAVALDVNAHYVVQLSDVFGFYPLAGVDLSFWKWHHAKLDVNDFGKKDNNHKETRLGVNSGFGNHLSNRFYNPIVLSIRICNLYIIVILFIGLQILIQMTGG